MKSLQTLKRVLGFAVSVTASEHFFSTFLSSPVTVQTLYKDDPEAQRIVKKNLVFATVISLAFGGVISYWLGDPMAIIGALIVVMIYGAIYGLALRGAL